MERHCCCAAASCSFPASLFQHFFENRYWSGLLYFLDVRCAQFAASWGTHGYRSVSTPYHSTSGGSETRTQKAHPVTWCRMSERGPSASMFAAHIDDTWFCVQTVPGFRRLLHIAFRILPDCMCRTQHVDVLAKAKYKGFRPRNWDWNGVSE